MAIIYYVVLMLFVFITNSHGLPIDKDSPTRRRNPEEAGGKFEGDVVLPPSARAVFRGDSISWPNGIVPYLISSLYTNDQRNAIIFAMRLLESLTAVNNVACVTFRDKVASDGVYYITIFPDEGCYSLIGRSTGFTADRSISLEYPDCFYNGTIMHELLHTLGFVHEQSRPDRDDYVTINFANIDPTKVKNFQKYNSSVVDTLNTLYDYGSVMHYGPTAFSINNLPTIEPRNSDAVIGQRITLSPTDIEEVRIFYNCTGSGTTLSTTTTSTTITTTSTQSTTLSLSLTIGSLQYRRIGGVSSNYYYLTKQVIISVTGYYTFKSSSAFAMYFFLYSNSFEPSNTNTNLMIQGHSNAGDGQLQFTTLLSVGGTGSKRKRATAIFTLVSTTQDEGVTGPFSIAISGPSTVTITTPDNSVITITDNGADSGKLAGIIVGSVIGGILLLICLCSLCLACLGTCFYCLKGRPLRSHKAYVQNGFRVQNDLGNVIFQPSSFTGYYFKDGTWRGLDKFILTFHPQADHTVFGKGTDDRGTYVGRGVYSPRTLRMGFDKLYQAGSEDTQQHGGQIMKIQVEWDPETQSFGGKYYSRAGNRREEQRYMIQKTHSKYRT